MKPSPEMESQIFIFLMPTQEAPTEATIQHEGVNQIRALNVSVIRMLVVNFLVGNSLYLNI